MSPSSTKKLADKVQAWNPLSFARIGKGIQDNLPRSSEEVRQRLRSWNKSLGRHFRTHDSSSRYPGQRPRTAQDQESRTSWDLAAAHKAMAENAGIAKVPRGWEKLDKSSSQVVSNGIKHRAHHESSKSRTRTPLVEVNNRLPTNIRGSHSSSRQSVSASGLGSKPLTGSEIHRTVQDKDRTYEFKFQRVPPDYFLPAATPVLHHSASVSDLADYVLESVKKLRRSASNMSLRRKFDPTDPDGERASSHVPVKSTRHSAPPASRQNSIQRSYTSLDFQHPDQHSNPRVPLLEPIAENSDSQQPRSGVVRQDLIFALHESRDCVPLALPRTSKTHSRRSHSFSEQERSKREPRRVSSQHSHRSSTTSVQLAEQISWLSDMAALRTSINNTRAFHGIPPLAFYQALCAEAKIIATTYEMIHGPGGNTWGTEIHFHENPATLEVIGPPGVGGRCTGKMWAEGMYSRGTQRSHARLVPRDHQGCQCHNYKVWEAITDIRWRAIGLSRTDEDERWVVVISE